MTFIKPNDILGGDIELKLIISYTFASFNMASDSYALGLSTDNLQRQKITLDYNLKKT